MKLSNLALKLSAAAMLIASGCCPKSLVLQAPVISMTKAEAASPLSEGGEVTAKWCTGDDKFTGGSEDGELGLIDEVTAKAQKENKAEYLMNARFYQSCSCMIVDANVGLAKGGRAGANDDDAPKKKGMKRKKKKAKGE